MGDFKDMDDDSRQMIVDETAYMAREMMDELAVKFMWDVFMALMNPDDHTKKRIINAIAKIAVDRIRDDMAKDAEDVDAEDFEFCQEISDEGISKAFERFESNMTNVIVDPEFVEEVVKAMGTNLVRSSVDKIVVVDDEESDE